MPCQVGKRYQYHWWQKAHQVSRDDIFFKKKTSSMRSKPTRQAIVYARLYSKGTSKASLKFQEIGEGKQCMLLWIDFYPFLN
jgi:hypothetical protein